MLPLETNPVAESICPEPELYNARSVMFTRGDKLAGEFVELLNVKSGMTRHTNPKLWPSPMSNSDDEMYALMA